MRAAIEDDRRALCRFVTSLHRLEQEVRLELLTTLFRQFRISSFFYETAVPFDVYFDLRNFADLFTCTNSYITHYMKGKGHFK